MNCTPAITTKLPALAVGLNRLIVGTPWVSTLPSAMIARLLPKELIIVLACRMTSPVELAMVPMLELDPPMLRMSCPVGCKAVGELSNSAPALTVRLPVTETVTPESITVEAVRLFIIVLPVRFWLPENSREPDPAVKVTPPVVTMVLLPSNWRLVEL